MDTRMVTWNDLVRRSRAWVAVLFALLVLLPAAVVAQDGGKGAEAPKAVTSGDPSVSVEELQLRLEPLTKSELQTEAAAWFEEVRKVMAGISEAQIGKLKAKDDAERQKFVDQLVELEKQKTALLQRFDAVLKACEAKGAETTEYRGYLKAATGFKVDTTDAVANISVFRGWLTSKEGGIRVGLQALKFLGIMFAAWLLASLGHRLVRHATEKRLDWPELLEQFITKLTYRGVLLIGLLVALSSIGVNVGALFALIGGGAFIIGFAMQDTLGNFAAGLMLLIYRPFDVGDVVEVGGVSGKVERLSVVSTTIKTFDNKVVLVPNKNVWGQVITNATASGERRVDMTFGIGYGDDIDRAQEILERVVSGHDKVLGSPAPVIRVNELADSSVNFIVRPWTKTADYWDVYWDITRRVKDEFDAAGISIPYPQQDVHLYQESAQQQAPEERRG
jgi:small conductance mechanosensitive channel